jgi:hypothetical protein
MRQIVGFKVPVPFWLNAAAAKKTLLYTPFSATFKQCQISYLLTL